jgi:hypothetical protein
MDMSGAMRCVIFAPGIKTMIRLRSAAQSLRRYYADAPEIMSALRLAGQSSRIVYAGLPPAEFTLRLFGKSVRHLTPEASPALMNLHNKGSAAIFGYSTITLPGLVIPPGGDLEIDTEQMTISLSGEDVTRYFGADSEFFKLKPGENTIIYVDGVQSRNISYKLLWKDLWL